MRPSLSFEVREPITADLVDRFAREIVGELTVINADFRTAMVEHCDGVLPVVRLYAAGDGPFRRDRDRIKQTRLVLLAAT